MQTKILVCKCEHEYQDKIYGKFHRIHIKSEKNKSYRCTVCNKEKLGSDNK